MIFVCIQKDSIKQLLIIKKFNGQNKKVTFGLKKEGFLLKEILNRVVM